MEEVQITDKYTWYSVVLAILLFLLCQLQLVFYLHAEQLTLRLALKIKTALMGMIYKKVYNITAKNEPKKLGIDKHCCLNIKNRECITWFSICACISSII